MSRVIRLSPLPTTASLISIDRHYRLLLVRVSFHHQESLLTVASSRIDLSSILPTAGPIYRSNVIAFYFLNHTVEATSVLGVMMLTYDHDGHYNITIISKNNDAGDHFQGRRQHYHQHHYQHNHFSAFTSSPTTDVSSLPTIASSSINPSSMPTAANPVVMMLLVVVTMQH